MMSHLVEAGLAQAAAEGGVAGAGQCQGPLCPVPLELASLSVDVCRGVVGEKGVGWGWGGSKMGRMWKK